VLKVAHHGSQHSSTVAFLRAVAPQIAIISAGAPNRYGHPEVEAIDRLRSIGARVFRTDQQGTISLRTDGVQIGITTDASPVAYTLAR
jgi:competence protein ComEC